MIIIGILKAFYDGDLDCKKIIDFVRDLTIIHVNADESLLLAVDSDGGIGSKEMDVVKVKDHEIGYFAARVPLMEVMAANARPMLVVDALSVEMKNTGEGIIAGIKELLKEADMPDLPITGSTEENIPTSQTGVGVVVLGIIDKRRWTIGSSARGDLVGVAGIPKSGPEHEVKASDVEILKLQDLQKLRNTSGVHDVLPVGSKGIDFESKELAGAGGLFFEKLESEIDFQQSGGPSTSVIFSAENKEILEKIRGQISAPVNIIGQLK
ncbi:MAG: AIR synthase related protein [Halanaerobiales bacterium]